MQTKRLDRRADHKSAPRVRPRRTAIHRGAFICSIAATAWLVVSSGCSDAKVISGEQCPGPYSASATLASPDAGRADIYGTSCAPCEGAGTQFDVKGCPIFVTFESCGGDICIGSKTVRKVLPPDDDDAGADDDGGAEQGDTGAP